MSSAIYFIYMIVASDNVRVLVTRSSPRPVLMSSKGIALSLVS